MAIAGLVVIAVMIPLALGAAAGSALIGHNDDPSMRRAAIALYETGHIVLDGWTSMTLIGWLLFVQPFLWATGGGAWAFAAATAVMSVVGILAGYVLARQLLKPARATLAMLLILLFPGFLVNTTTFMTDVPAWAMASLSLALGAVALSRGGRWLAASMVVGIFAFSIREFAAAAPAAVLVAHVMAAPRNIRSLAVTGLAALGAGALIFLYAHHLPGQHESPLPLDAGRSLVALQRAFATLALVLSPALLISVASWWRRWHFVDGAIGAVVGALLLWGQLETVFGSSGTVLIGNLLTRYGVLGTGQLPGRRPVLFDGITWDVLNVTAAVSAVVLCAVLAAAAGLLVRGIAQDAGAGALDRVRGRLGSIPGMLVVYALGYGVGVSAWGFTVIMFDRYLWFLVLPMAILLLSPPPAADNALILADEGHVKAGRSAPRRAGSFIFAPRAILAPAVAGMLLTGLALTSTVLLLNANAFDAARWRIGERAVRLGYAADTVDAGLEWVASQASGLARPYAVGPPELSRYVAWWPPGKVCVEASSSPLDGPGIEQIAVEPDAYRMLLFAGRTRPLYLYRVTGHGCP